MNFDLDSLVTFCTVTATEMSETVKNVLAKLSGDGGDDDSDNDEVIDDVPLWGSAGVLMRPADPTDGGAFEQVFIRRNDQMIPITSRDVRWQIDLEKGEVILRSMSDSASMIKMKPDGKIILDGVVEIGEGATEAAVLGDSLKSWLEAHTHPSAMGPTGVPVEAGTLSTVLSTLHTVT